MSRAFNYEPSFKVGGATIGPCLFCTLDTTTDEQVIQSVAGDLPIGVSQEGMRDTPGLTGSDTTVAARSGDTGMRVIGLGNEAMLTCGGTVKPGYLLKSDSSGRGISASSNDNYGAVALQAGTTGVKIKVIVRPGKA